MKPSAPLVLVTGFLGAGKTTFLRDVLPLLEACGLDPFVIINDYANAAVDASSLAKEGRTVTPLNGNCICCDSLIELIDVLLQIPEAPRRVVLIEANGTTDPTALIEHLLVHPELHERFAPVLQVAVVDVQRWQKRREHNDLERLQVETASHLLLTREETESEKRVASVRDDIEWFNPKAEWIKRHPFALLIERLVKQRHSAPRPHERRKASPEAGHHHQHSHDHTAPSHDHRHHLAHAFVGLKLGLPEPVSAAKLHLWLKSLPAEVLRVKGVARLTERPDQWFQFQRADEYESAGEAILFELPEKPLVPACAVLIGVNLDEEKLHCALRELIGEAPAGARETRLTTV